MAKSTIKLPEGFVLDKPNIPEGFVLDAPIQQAHGPQDRASGPIKDISTNLNQLLNINPKIGFGESIKEEFTRPAKGAQLIPGIGGIVGAAEQLSYLTAAQRLKSDYDYTGPISPGGLAVGAQGMRPPTYATLEADEKLIGDMLIRTQQQQERGYSFGGHVAKGLLALPTWMAEFAMTGGLAKLGSTAAQNAGEKLLKSYAKTKAGQLALKTAGWTGGAITRATLGLAPRTLEETVGRQVKVQILGADQEGWATSFLKSWGNQVIESASETAGEAITGFPVKLLSKSKFGAKFINKLRTSWREATGGTAAEFAKKMLTKGGYSNIIGEYGEETLGSLLRGLTGVDDFGAKAEYENEKGKGSWDKLSVTEKLNKRMRGVLQQEIDPMTIATRATVLSIPMAGRVAIGVLTGGGDRVRAEDDIIAKIKETQTGIAEEPARQLAREHIAKQIEYERIIYDELLQKHFDGDKEATADLNNLVQKFHLPSYEAYLNKINDASDYYAEYIQEGMVGGGPVKSESIESFIAPKGTEIQRGAKGGVSREEYEKARQRLGGVRTPSDEATDFSARIKPKRPAGPNDQARFDKNIDEMEAEQARHLQAIAAEGLAAAGKQQAPAQQPTQKLSPKDQARQDTRKKLLMGVPDAELEKRLRNTKVSSPFFREIYDEIVRRKEQTPAPEAAQAPQPQIQPISEHEAVETPQKPPQAITKPELARRGGAVEGAIHKKIQQLHDAPARIKGFELSRDAEVKKYFKNLRAAAKDKNLLQALDDVERKEAEIQIIKAVDKAESLYYSGDCASAISESEKALQWIHERAVIQHGPDFLRELEEDIPQPEAVEISRKSKNLGITKKDLINSIMAKGFTHELSDKLKASGYLTDGQISYLGGSIDQAFSDSTNTLEEKVNSLEMAIRQFLPSDISIFKEDVPELPAAQKQLTPTKAVEGKVYHGTSTKVTELKKDTYSTVNIYGQGFYTTSEESVAKGYTKKGKGTAPAVHEVILNKGAEDKLFDMEQPITEDVKGIVREAFEDYGYVLDESSNLREAYDNFRDEATADGLSADSVQEYFEEAQKALEKKGYIGLKHKGGLQFKGKPHDVRIFWNPKRDLQLTPTKAVEAPVTEKVEPVTLSDKEFPKVYRQYGKITAEAEKNKFRAMTQEEQELWRQGENWEEFSKKQGYSEKEIEDFRYWTQLNDDPRAMAARGFEDLPELDRKEAKLAADKAEEEMVAKIEAQAVEAPVTEKQPWEMTKQEFGTSSIGRIFEITKETEELAKSYGAMGAELVNPKQMARVAKQIEKLAKEKANYTNQKWVDRQHKKSVQQALSENKPVPPEVLAEYPGLKPEGKAVEPEIPDEELGGITKRIISKDAYDKAKKRLTDRGKLSTGIDPQGLMDLVTVGAYHIENGLTTFGKWAQKMIEEFGDKVKPHLRDVWKDARYMARLKETAEKSVKFTSGMDPGIDKFIAEDVKPTVQKTVEAAKAIRKIGSAVPKLFMRMVEPARAAEKATGQEAYAAVIRGIHKGSDVARFRFDQMRIDAMDTNMEGLKQYFDQYTEEDNLNFMLAFAGRPGSVEAEALMQDAYNKLPGALKNPTLVKAVREISEKNHKRLVQVTEGNVGWVQDYFYGIYKNPDLVDRFFKYWKTTKKFTKHKTHPSLADAVNYGVEPRRGNYIDNLRAEYMGIERLGGMKWLKEKLLKDGKGIYIDNMMDAPVEWSSVKDPVFAAVAMKPELADMINNLISTNKITQRPVLNAFRKIGNFLRILKFVGSIFHLRTIAKQAAADSGFLGFYKKTALRGFQTATKKQWLKLQKTPEYQRLLELGIGHRYSYAQQAQKQFRDFVNKINSGNYIGATFRAAKIPLKIPLGFTEWMFNQYIPMVKALKVLDAQKELEEQKGRPATDWETINIIKETQNFYGEMNERLFGRSGTVTTGMRFVYLAPGFAEGNYRTILKSLLQWGRGGKGWSAGRSRANMPNSLLITATIATAGTLILTGKPPKKPETVEDIRDLFKIDTGLKDKRGRKVMIDMMTYDKDYFNIYFNVLRGRPDVAAYESLRRLGGMKSPMFDMFLDFARMSTGRALYDWKGDRVTEITDTSLEKLMKIAVHEIKKIEPISVSVFKQARQKDVYVIIAFVEAVMGVRPTVSEKDKSESEILRRCWSLGGQKEEMYYTLATIEKPRAAVKWYNNKVRDVLDSKLVPQAMKDEWIPKLTIDLEKYLQNKALTGARLPTSEKGKEQVEQAVKLLKNFDISPNAAEQLLGDYYNRPKTKVPYNPIESDRILGRAAKRKRLKERMQDN